ncbi:MAG: hypothetical protein KGI04_01265 [Candidatus Micrarchaeota archaeon]|nr:hypothetical protein [Candidatus Micrarchaeota archaeon]
MGNGNIRMRTATESFLLLHPDTEKSSHEVAMSIAACKGVRKVFITSGEVGFVVSTAENHAYNSEKVSRTITKVLGRGKVRIAKGHYVYAKSP